MDRAQLGQEVRRLRQRRGLTLREVEAASGVSYQYVSAIEHGAPNTNITLETLGRLLAAVGGALKIGEAVTTDPLSPLLDVARSLTPADLDRLVRIARALPQLGARTADVMVAAIEGAAEDAGGR